MSTATVTHHSPDASPSITGAAPRIVAIDILRGLNMALMIFVNELAGVRNLPWWTYHAKTQWDVMTYVDMVYPGFLFIVGMSLPIAIAARLRRNPSQLALWGHVITRSIALFCLGMILANASKAAPTMILSRRWWELIGIFGGSLFLSTYPIKTQRGKRIHQVLRVLGVAMMIFAFATFHRGAGRGAIVPGQQAWLDFSYPEILGLIGYAYLATCILYIPFRKYIWAPLVALIGLVTYNALCMPKAMNFMFVHTIHLQKAIWSVRHLRGYLWPWENGSSASMVMAGIVLSVIFVQTRWSLSLKDVCRPRLRRRHWRCRLCAEEGLGISKNRGTPTWCLWTMAACIVLFAALYWILDVKKQTAWAAPFRSAGSNTLTTYLLPDYWGMVLGVTGITLFRKQALHNHWTGVVWCFFFTGLMLFFSYLITRAKVRLAL